MRSARSRACRPAACCSSASSPTSRTSPAMASATEAPPTAGVDAPAARLLREQLGDKVRGVDDFRGDLAITVAREAWVEAATLLRNHPDLDFKLFLDLCGVDYLEDRDDRFETVLHAYSVSRKHHVRLKTTLPEA